MVRDLYVIGGTTGATWKGPTGWATFVHVPAVQETKKLIEAGESTGLEALIKAFAAAVQWWHYAYNDDLVFDRPSVLLITDSPQLVAIGRGEQQGPDVWKYLQWFIDRGYNLDWVWQSRAEHEDVVQEAERAKQLYIEAIDRANARAAQSPASKQAGLGWGAST